MLRYTLLVTFCLINACCLSVRLSDASSLELQKAQRSGLSESVTASDGSPRGERRQGQSENGDPKINNEESLAVEAWDAFLKEPSERNFAALDEKFRDSKSETGGWIEPAVYRVMAYGTSRFWRYIEILKSGNIYAMRLALVLMQDADGAGLEDLYAAFGYTLTKRPVQFTRTVVEAGISDKRKLRALALAYPVEEVVDNTPKRLEVAEEKIRALQTVGASDLVETRDIMIDALRKRKEQLQERMNEDNSEGL